MPLESVSTVPRLVWEILIGTAGVSCLGGGGGSADSCPFAPLTESSTAAVIIIPNLNIGIPKEKGHRPEVNRGLSAEWGRA
jgi:hypothetical protein